MKRILVLAALAALVSSCGAGGGENSILLAETVAVTGRVDISTLSSSGRAGSNYPYILDIPADGVSKENVLDDDGRFYIRLKKDTPHMIAVFAEDSVFEAVLEFEGGVQLPLDESDRTDFDLGVISVDTASMRAAVGNDPVAAGAFRGSTNANLEADSNGDGRPDVTLEVTGAGTNLSDGKVTRKDIDITGDWRFFSLPTGGPPYLCAYIHQVGNSFEVYWETGDSDMDQYASGTQLAMSWERSQCGRRARYSLNGFTDGRLMTGQYSYSGGCGDSSGSWFAERAYCGDAHP